MEKIYLLFCCLLFNLGGWTSHQHAVDPESNSGHPPTGTRSFKLDSGPQGDHVRVLWTGSGGRVRLCIKELLTLLGQADPEITRLR